MKKQLQVALGALCLILLFQKDTLAQTSLLQDYQNTVSPTIGVYQGITFREAGFSGLYPIQGTNGTEFWTLSDRGVNIDCANANLAGCRPTYDKMYAFPSYAPKIHRIRIINGKVEILQTITVKRPNGTTATGIINPTGLGSTATEVASTDTVMDCLNFNLKVAQKDTFGIDPEGIVVDKNGNFWLCEEGGATIWKLNSNGVLIQRFTPYANMPGVQSVDTQIDTVYKYRKNNRGFEGIALAPNGKIYAIIQSPILYPTQAIGEASRIHRILEIDPVTNAQRMFAYLNDGIIGASGANQIRLKDWKIGDMAAINDSLFIVIEAALRGTTDIKKVYMININQATTVHSGLYSGVTLEALVDSTGLANNNIKPVKKTLVIDLLANGWPSALDKSEGLAIINDSTIAVCNDNDFGVASPNQDGLATATTNVSHVITFRLSGVNKLPKYKVPAPTNISLGQTGLSSSQTPYLTPAINGVTFTSIISTGDSTSTGYKMCGTPDGTGAFDNGNGTFTLLCNHEFVSTAGVARAHGSIGAFVSKWVINKSDLSVVSGADLIQNVNLYNGTGYTTYNAANPSALAAFGRFCSADLPAVTAYYNVATGMGTQERIFMNGEEIGNEGRAFGHIATGANAGTSYELPALGKFSIENLVANPTAQDKTIVAGMDDSTPGQVYIYIGTKTNTGTEVDKAGLTNGRLYGITVSGLTAEVNASVPTPGTAFTLTDLGNVKDSTGAGINTKSNNLGVTNFLRPEDGAWDPSNPSDLYVNTTNALTSPSRLWKFHFTDIKNPELGGTVTAVLDGTEGQKMLDNMAIDNYGHIVLLEDVGNSPHDGKIWQYTIATDKLTLMGQHDSTRFVSGGANFLTQDEETSGVIDVQSILGPGNFLVVDQAHYALPGQLVEGGQILKIYNDATYKASLGAGLSSSQTPYLTPASNSSGVKFTSIFTTGDTIGGYKMCGTPDGTGAFDNGDGTFTLLCNHEFVNTAGVARAHGSAGAFVSKWVIKKSDLSVISGGDLIHTVKLWNGSGYSTYTSANPSPLTAFSRFCSADLPAATAFYNATTGMGTQERIFMNGEETGNEGRAFGHIATGANAGTSYELPALGKASWENMVANATAQDKTIVAGMDDSTPGQVYVYIGTKTNSGTEVDKAGLTNGKLYGVSVTGMMNEANASFPTAGTQFTLVDLGNVKDSTGTGINTKSNNLGVTNFLRPEDGAWDPSNLNDFYFATTNAFGSPSRLWKLHFTDITNPAAGGTVAAVLDGTEGQQMLDNITIDTHGHILLVEDVGNNAHDGKVWQYTIASDKLLLLGQHDSARFVPGGANFLTQDEEASGILDVESILGPGNFLVVDQAHYGIAGELVEGGQILKLYDPFTAVTTMGAAPSSSQTPYVVPFNPASGVRFTSLLTTGDAVANNYRMAGTPDGTGAFDNGDGTFTLLCNHEFVNTVGIARAHGSAGAFVSKWTIDKTTLAVLNGKDLIKNVYLYNGTGYTLYNSSNPSPLTAFSRFCSADLPAVSAYYNAATGLGTQERIFMNGEETGNEGRAFGHIASGTNSGNTYELPALGKASWENMVANATPQDKTIVAGMDDSTPGQVYIYVGTKTNTGTAVDKAGLTNGKLYGISVTGMMNETNGSVPAAGTAFTLVDLGIVKDSTGAGINTKSNNLGVTNFLRPEDGAWDPSNLSDLYVNTTNAINSPSRLWKFHFTDIKNPELGGTVTAVLDGTEGQKMLDNMAIDNYGHIVLLEDVGNNIHDGKIWQYTIATDGFKELGMHDSARFVPGGANFLTQDEETSGIIDVQNILGPGYMLLVDQAHYTIPGELVEGGQILAMYNPDTYNSMPEVNVQGNSVNIVDGDNTPVATDNTQFGNVPLSTPQTKTFMIQNTGAGALTVKNITFSGANAADFSLVGASAFPWTVAAGGSQSISVKFAPAVGGNRTATINIASNDFNEEMYDFALAGTGVMGEINVKGNNLNIADGDLLPSLGDNTDFGRITSATSVNKTFTIQNTGGDALQVTGITFTGNNASAFSLVSAPAFPLTVAAGGSQIITVKFAPSVDGSYAASMVIANNDADEATYDFAIAGMGVHKEINVIGNNVTIVDGDVTPDANDNTNFGSVVENHDVTKTFVIQSKGTDEISVSGINISGTNAGDFTLMSAPAFPWNIVANGSQSISIKFTPADTGARMATLNIMNNDPTKGTYNFNIQGRGTSATGINNAFAPYSFVKLYPNPTDAKATISMMIRKEQHLVISVFDLQGKLVAPVMERDFSKGEQEVTLNTAGLNSGVYFVEIASGDFTSKIKIVVMH